MAAAGTKTKTNGTGTKPTPEVIGDPTNGASMTIDFSKPYVASVTIEGTCPILFHAWNCDEVEAKSASAKGSASRKTDNVESYVYRCPDGTIGIPGVYLVGALTNKATGAAKYRRDPRSPRKSALDLYKAGVVPLTEFASLGKADWDYLDRRRVVVNNAGVSRLRPAFLAGWKATFEVQVLLPEYIPPMELLSCLGDGGKLTGIADYRPTFGRFGVVNFEVLP